MLIENLITIKTYFANYKLLIYMKFIASSGLLLKELQMIGGIINNTTTLPILENFMFDINNDKLTLTASDLLKQPFLRK